MFDPVDTTEIEYLLELAGEPQSKSEILMVAQTKAIVALVHALSPQPHTFYSNVGVPANVTAIWSHARITVPEGKSHIARMLVYVPDFDQRKINAIKELRLASGLGLKESKDIVEQMATDLASGRIWWT